MNTLFELPEIELPDIKRVPQTNLYLYKGFCLYRATKRATYLWFAEWNGQTVAHDRNKKKLLKKVDKIAKEHGYQK